MAGGVPAPPGCAYSIPWSCCRPTALPPPGEAGWGTAEDAPELGPLQDRGNKEPSPTLVPCQRCRDLPGLRLQSPVPHGGGSRGPHKQGCIPQEPSRQLCVGQGGCAEGLLVWGMVVPPPELGSSQTGAVPQPLLGAGKGNGATVHERGRLQRRKHPTGSENCCRIGLEMS